MQTFDRDARLFKALMHPVRLAILDILRDGEACVCHLEAALRQRQAYISQQLMVLREAGLIQDRRDGWNVYYSVVDARLYRVLDAARTLRAEVGQRPERQPPVAEGCTCPKCSPAGVVEESQLGQVTATKVTL